MVLLRKKLKSFLSSLTNSEFSPAALTVLTAGIAFLYVFAEWIFIFTRPSYLKTVVFSEKILALVTSAGVLILVSLLVLLPFLLLGVMIKGKTPRKIASAIAILIPAILLSSLVLLLVDNFTYTVFHFGIVSTSGFLRVLYAVIFSILGIFFYTRLAGFEALLATFLNRWQPKKRRLVLAILLVLAAALTLLPVNNYLSRLMTRKHLVASQEKLPDILLITVDGVNAEYTSIYGGDRDTTPFLRELAKSSLLAQNDFTDAQGTIGSLTSMLTGKLPADIRVIYSSDVLKGEDAYQHLPGILKDYGYYTAQLSNELYADAYSINFQNAFDEANGRSAKQEVVTYTLSTLYPGTTFLFQEEMIGRVLDRLGHIFFIKDMANPYQQVTEAPIKFNDAEKMAKVISLLKEHDQPVFIHLHWMGTHGPNYYPEKQVFSAGKDINKQEIDRQLYYYDSILEFDQAMQALYQELTASGLLKNTLMVVTSDHSQKWTNARIPLMIHFPDSKNTKTVSENVQSIDIAPTLLGYLGIPQPAWMSGQSLLSDPYKVHPIFTAKIPESTKDAITGKIIYPESKAPFYQFGRMSVIECDQWIELNLSTLAMTGGKVAYYTTPCASEVSQLDALNLLAGHLQKYGFDVTSLQKLRVQLLDSK